ncbi:zinc finger (CCCH type) motif-containing protein, partial [Cardiosporidium cionae]
MFRKRVVQTQHKRSHVPSSSHDEDDDSQQSPSTESASSHSAPLPRLLLSEPSRKRRREISAQSAGLAMKTNSDTSKETTAKDLPVGTYESDPVVPFLLYFLLCLTLAFPYPFSPMMYQNLFDGARATVDFDVDTDKSHDNRAILERRESIGKALLKGELEEGIYRGKDAHRPIINTREGAIAAGKYTGHYGPVRGSQTIRMTMRVDYNPEICKDYKETGYCGFGDTCKFLHDRTDYKEGWQLDKDWNNKQKAKSNAIMKAFKKSEGDPDLSNSGEEASEESEDEDALPKVCAICKEKWTLDMAPVVTLCSHYFCEKCA